MTVHALTGVPCSDKSNLNSSQPYLAFLASLALAHCFGFLEELVDTKTKLKGA